MNTAYLNTAYQPISAHASLTESTDPPARSRDNLHRDPRSSRVTFP
jgi:hypothetical protein